jgi:Flp pilus assembly protein TadG
MDPLARLGIGAARGERGAVASIVAVLLGGSVLFGCAALAVDVGSVMFERRQLQNGADAASLTLGKTCAATIANCSTANTTTMANVTKIDNVNNTRDQVGGVDSVCGMNLPAGSSLPTCPTTPSGGVDCPPVPANLVTYSVPYVEVRTVTKEASGSSSITNVFSRMTGGRAQSTVRACARAAWGAPSGGDASLPITVSGCDWQHASGGNAGGGNGSYYTSPVYNGVNAYGYGGVGQPAWPTAAATPPAQNPGGEIILMIQNPSGSGGHTMPTACSSWQGHALPGGFGLLETAAGDPCKVVTYPNNWVHTNAGSSTGCDLSSFVGKVVNIPVFDCTASALPATAAIPPPGGDCTQGSGSNAWYHRQGFAKFYLSGYNVTTTGSVTNHAGSLVPPNHAPCNGGDSCISGWFLTGELAPTGGGGGGSLGPPGFGPYVVVPAG